MSSEDLTVGYCTNVHAGIDLPAIQANLDQYAVAVRDHLLQDASDTTAGLRPDQPLGVGLWIPDAASRELAGGTAAVDFASFLQDRQLNAFTINGFPFDNFHQDVVKHRVYLPTWGHRERLEYTQRLADILCKILPDSQAVGSISTLPIGWPHNPNDDSGISAAADLHERAGGHLREMADYLAGLESRTGRRIVVAIEPEPGCVLDTTDDVIEFFDRHLPDKNHRRYLTVCHDVCHAAVMMERQAEVIGRFAAAGIGIGKVQVSSAIVAMWQSMSVGRRAEALEQLAKFAEDRYLHQTGRRDIDGQFSLAEDLPELIRQAREIPPESFGDDRWVVHFHVPIFLERFGHLTTSHDDVRECLRTLIGDRGSKSESEFTAAEFTGHLEVETYAWTVLPDTMRKRALADDIAGEIQWLTEVIATCCRGQHD
ncbi:MAG: metabolite traffic protein EboE [Pirellulaceae bacterium]|nr:metabolite traffic protein EboE [Pirellulaceae bacterium]